MGRGRKGQVPFLGGLRDLELSVSAQATSLKRASGLGSAPRTVLPAHPTLGIPTSPLLAFATKAKWTGKGISQPARGCWPLEGVSVDSPLASPRDSDFDPPRLRI